MDEGLKKLYIHILGKGYKIVSYMVSESKYTLIILGRGPYESKIFVRLNEEMK